MSGISRVASRVAAHNARRSSSLISNSSNSTELLLVKSNTRKVGYIFHTTYIEKWHVCLQKINLRVKRMLARLRFQLRVPSKPQCQDFASHVFNEKFNSRQTFGILHNCDLTPIQKLIRQYFRTRNFHTKGCFHCHAASDMRWLAVLANLSKVTWSQMALCSWSVRYGPYLRWYNFVT